MKTLQRGQKSILCKVGAEEGAIAGEIRVIKKKPRALPWDSKKEALEEFQELSRLHSLQAQGHESVNFFEKLCFEKKVSGQHAYTGPPRKLFPQESFQHVQMPRHSEASAAMV